MTWVMVVRADLRGHVIGSLGTRLELQERYFSSSFPRQELT